MITTTETRRYAPDPSVLLHGSQFGQGDAVLAPRTLGELGEIGFLGNLENRVSANQAKKNSPLPSIWAAHVFLFWHESP